MVEIRRLSYVMGEITDAHGAQCRDGSDADESVGWLFSAVGAEKY
jgi:hypothetical protein